MCRCLLRSPRAQWRQQALAPSHPRFSGAQPLKVLLAEDRQVIRLLVVALPEKMSHQLSIAEGGTTALAALVANYRRHDVAQGAYAEIPIIFVTAVDAAQGKSAGPDPGAVDYITKQLAAQVLPGRAVTGIDGCFHYCSTNCRQSECSRIRVIVRWVRLRCPRWWTLKA